MWLALSPRFTEDIQPKKPTFIQLKVTSTLRFVAIKTMLSVIDTANTINTKLLEASFLSSPRTRDKAVSQMILCILMHHKLLSNKTYTRFANMKKHDTSEKTHSPPELDHALKEIYETPKTEFKMKIMRKCNAGEYPEKD